jgi:5-methyltetrahydropteroyltriglutamate--homocysteine methyltransferase
MAPARGGWTGRGAPPMTPYRADHVGSLLRPPELLEARLRHASGRLDAEGLRALEDVAIAEALERQRQIGLDVLGDGEMRRSSWLTGLADAVEGFTDDRLSLEWKGPGGGVELTMARVAGAKLRKRCRLTERELPFLERHAGGPFKVTLPAPSNFMFASYKPGVTDRVYPTRAALLEDVSAILRDEVDWLVQRGVPYIQFDAPYYSHYLDPAQRDRFRRQGLDPDRLLRDAIEGDNAAVRGLPRDRFTWAIHVCRGNNRSRWYMEGGYDAIAEALFTALEADRFLLEFDDERSGGFAPLRFVPAGTLVVLGLVTTKQAALESADDLRRRIDQAARHVPLERLAISPQCGFASIIPGNLLSLDDQWRKLELVVGVARAVWDD